MGQQGGHNPGTFGRDLRGLQVKHAEAVAEVGKHGFGKRTGNMRPAGWYVWVQFGRGHSTIWEAVLALRFVRESDAQRAAYSLLAAGLDSAKRMKVAGAELVIRTAFEALAW